MAARTKANPLNGMHSAGIFADMSVDGPEIGTLVLVVDRAKNLPNRKTIGKQDPYCAARLGKEAKKTTTDIRGGQTPKWDQEIRFTVHDSPDYYQLKLSLFNDDKKTELIGEAWVDLRDIIVPGGGQNDQWQSLNCKGKYAGEIRIEITYYDSRPKPDKPMPKARPVASEQDGGSQRSAVKRRPLPSNPGSIESSPAPKVKPDHVQTPPRPQPNVPATSFIPNQSPLQAVEYNTPPSTRFSQSDRYSPAPEHGGRHEMNEKLRAYDDDLYLSQEQQARSYELDSRGAYNHSQPVYDSPPPTGHHQRQAIQDDDRPPPPPVHRVRNNSGNSLDLANRSSLDMSPQGKAMSSMPMRHDVLRNEAHRLSISMVPPASTPSSSSSYPGRPIYRPYESAPNASKELAYNDPNYSSPPRHHSYDSVYDNSHRSMQATVEDVPESWTPPNAKSRHGNSRQEHYDDVGYGQASSPAPLNLGGRGSAASGHFTPSPSQIQGHYGPNGHNTTPSPGAPREYSRNQHGHFTNSFNSDDDPYSNHTSEMDGALVRGSYALPPVPSTLVPGVDPELSLEIASRFHEDRKHERRYTQPPPMGTPSRGRQQSEPPYTHAQPSPYAGSSTHSRNYGGSPVTYSGGSSTSPGPVAVGNPRRLSPSPNPNHTIKRKSVSPAPPQESRRISDVPFGPDSYDALNPSVISAKDELKSGEYTNAYGKIVTADGREVDPSDHLPMDTWAPEPEPKGPKQIMGPEIGSQPPSGRRQIRISTRPQSMAVLPSNYTSPGAQPSPPPSTGRNRLQKKAHRVPALPAPISGGSSPLGPATAHQRNSTPPRALVRASTFDYENYGPPYGSSPSSARGPLGNGPPVPAKVPLMSGGITPANDSFGGGGGGANEWALMEEMSRIDIGTGRARRHGGY